MKLDVIPAVPSSAIKTAAAPILFVHGAWHQAGCWQEFADYCRQQGRACHAVSLRGHGNSENDRSLKRTRVDGYVADVGRTVEAITGAFGQKPVLVGHSMGGLVVQKYLEQDAEIPHGVLMAATPPNGVWPIALRLTLKHPL